MGRLFRLIKLTLFIGSLFSAVMMFSAFKPSSEIDMSFGEELQVKVIEGIEKGRDLTKDLVKGSLPESLLKGAENTRWFHERVDQQKKQDIEANKKRDNSYIYHHNGKKWVYIQGKYYEYDRSNSYFVNGVRTYYKPPKSGKASAKDMSSKSGQHKVSSTKYVKSAAESGANQALEDPTKVYSRSGMAHLKQNLENIQVQMKNRNEMLKKIDQQQ